jgi:anti-sigma regulatory factor (Ser/Thr protein kinase)
MPWESKKGMCREGVLWRFCADEALAAIGHRSRFVSSLRRHSGWAIDEYAASVVFSELVGNVATHSPGPIEIVLECNNRDIVLKVTDRGSGFRFAPALPPDVLSEGGRGLYLVSKYATNVELNDAGPGTTVRATLPRKT